MKINSIIKYGNPNTQTFGTGRQNNNKIVKDQENPISRPLEKLDVFKATLVAGLGIGARGLYYAIDDGLIETTFKAGQKIAEKNFKGTKSSTQKALGIVSMGAILVGIVGIIAAIYAIYNTPKAMYQGEINAHKKSEDMDVYLKGNRIEKDLYDQLGQSAKVADEKEKEHLKQQYMKLAMAKNEIPNFVKFNSPKNKITQKSTN